MYYQILPTFSDLTEYYHHLDQLVHRLPAKQQQALHLRYSQECRPYVFAACIAACVADNRIQHALQMITELVMLKYASGFMVKHYLELHTKLYANQ